MDRWPYGNAPEGYITYLLRLHKQYGQRLSNVRIKPPNGIYIGKGSPWANPFRGSTTVQERINNIYNFDRYYRKEFLKKDGPLNYSNVWYTFAHNNLYHMNSLRPMVCYCNDGTNIPNVNHLCHGLIIIASIPKAMTLTQQDELDEVFQIKE